MSAVVGRADFAVTGVGLCRPAVEGPVDPRPLLKSPKTRKFMGLQDELAVVAAGRALADAGLGGVALGPRAGVFFVVGHIPFEQGDVDALLDASLGPDGALDMQRFSTAGMDAVSPLLTFRCLPNMPAYHVSANFDVQGPYFVGYPGVEQCYAALDEALAALSEGEIDVALVGGVAHQRNFLVEAHFARLTPPTGPEALFDAAAVLVIERVERATARGARMRAVGVASERVYAPVSPFVADPGSAARNAAAEHAAALPLAVADALNAAPGALFEHHCRTADGFVGVSRWGGGAAPLGGQSREAGGGAEQ